MSENHNFEAEGWGIKKVREIGQIISGSTPSTNIKSNWYGDIIWITPNDLSHLSIPYFSDSEKKITNKGYKSCSTVLLPEGSIVISSRAPIGYLAIAKTPFCTNQGCKSVKLNSNYNSEYIYYNLLLNVGKLKNIGEGTTFSELSKNDFSNFELFISINESEQNQIAKILSTVDNAIEQTEILIAKYEKIKTGLMQDLLTKGIDENGKIRSEETHEFKDSPLGKIPVEWEIMELGKLVKEFTLGTTKRGIKRNDDIIPLLKMGNLNWGKLNFNKLEYISKSYINDLKIFLKYRDLLFNTRNTPELVGKVAIWRKEFETAVFDNNILCIRFVESIASPIICYYMSFGKGKDAIKNIVDGTTSVAAIYWKNLKKYLFPIPKDKHEQNIIIEKIESIDNYIGKEKKKVLKYQKIKTGLMQDLLTGKL